MGTKVGKNKALQAPDPRRAVPQERPSIGFREISLLGLGRDHRPELIAGASTGHIGAYREFRPLPSGRRLLEPRLRQIE